jgi:hypothetical protein
MFAKVFEQILDSSIASDWQIRHVFEDFLKLARKVGSDWIVDMTPDSISRRTGVPLDIVERAITNLESPDTQSRTPDHDGRRLIRLDEHRSWGWIIVNYQKYREIASKEMVRMSEAERKKEYRSRSTPLSPFPPVPPNPCTPVQSTDTEAERSRVGPGHVPDRPSLNNMVEYGKTIGLSVTESTKCFDYYQSNGWKVGRNPMKDWKASIRNWSRNVNATTQKHNPPRYDRNATTVNDPDKWAAARAAKEGRENLPGL